MSMGSRPRFVTASKTHSEWLPISRMASYSLEIEPFWLGVPLYGLGYGVCLEVVTLDKFSVNEHPCSTTV